MASTTDQLLQQNTNQLKALTDAILRQQKNQSDFTRENNKVIDENIDNLEDFSAEILNASKINKKQSKVQAEINELKNKEKQLEQDLNRLKADQQKLNVAHMSMTKEQIEQEKKEREESIKAKENELNNLRENIDEKNTEFKKLGNIVGGIGAPFLALAAILKYIGGGFLELNKQILEATTASHGVIEATSSTFELSMADLKNETYSLGLSLKQLGEVTAKNRQILNAVGGREAFEDILKTNENMRAFYGDLNDTAQANAQIVSEFGKKGILPTQETLNQYNADLTKLAMTTNLSASELNNMINSLANDTDSLEQLKAVREDERMTILANQRALLKSNVALGMTAEQAAEAGKMLNKMSSQNPLERYKQAAKMQAMGAAVGLGSEAAAAAAELRKPKGQQNQEILRDFNVKMTGLVDTAAQQGIGQEIFMSQMVDKLDMNQYYGDNSPFSTTLGNVIADGVAKMGDRYQSSATSMIVPINNVADKLINVLEAIKDGTMIATWTGQGIFQLLDAVKNMNLPTVHDLIDPFVTSKEEITNNLTGISDFFSKLTTPGDMKPPREESPTEPQKTEISIQNPDTQKVEISEKNPITTVVSDTSKDMFKIFEDMRKKLEAPPPENPTIEIPAVPLPPTQISNVKIVPDTNKESVEQLRTDKSETLMTNHLNIASKQVDKIEEQLQKMNNANEYLKILADTNPKLLDIAEKQLVALTLNEQQKQQMSSKLRNESAKFASDYSYVI